MASMEGYKEIPADNEEGVESEAREESRKAPLAGWKKFAAVFGLAAAAVSGAGASAAEKPASEHNGPVAALNKQYQELQDMGLKAHIETVEERKKRLEFFTAEADTDQIDAKAFTNALEQRVSEALAGTAKMSEEGKSQREEEINKKTKAFYEKYTRIIKQIEEMRAAFRKSSGSDAEALKKKAVQTIADYRVLMEEVKQAL